MKSIRYRVVTSEGRDFIVDVYARSIDTGFAKAVYRARRNLLVGENLHSVEFWEVRS